MKYCELSADDYLKYIFSNHKRLKTDLEVLDKQEGGFQIKWNGSKIITPIHNATPLRMRHIP